MSERSTYRDPHELNDDELHATIAELDERTATWAVGGDAPYKVLCRWRWQLIAEREHRERVTA